MPRTRRELLGAAAASALLAGCLGGNGDDGTDGGDGGADGTDGGTTTAGDDTTADGTAGGDGTATGATVTVAEHDDLGEILVGPNGMTLYVFDSDEQGAGESTCTGGCLGTWPALTVDGEPTAGDGVTAELSTFERENGETQVAADGWPLYYYAPDAEPGEAAGQGVNDVWWVLGPDGTVVRDGAGTTADETTSGGGGGYGDSEPY